MCFIMKNIMFLLAASVLLLSSCYCNKTTVGTINPDEELVHVKSVRNTHVLGGLIVCKDKVKSNVPNVENYVIESKTTFGDGLLSCLTFGIYTPNTTKYYVPKSNPNVVVLKKKKMSKAYQGYLKE